MKRMTFLTFLMVAGYVATAQSITTKDVESAWDNMTSMVVETANNMPAEHFSYSPIEPLSDFAGLINHTTGANYLFAATVGLDRPDPMPGGEASSKDEVIKDLEASFAYIKKGIQNLDQEDLEEEIDWFGSKMTRLHAILTMTDHVERQHGKAITYVRLKGVEPARSGGW